MIGIPSESEIGTSSDASRIAELTLALRLSQMEVAALNEMLDAYRDRLAALQAHDRLAGALDIADLKRLTNERQPATAVSRPS